MEKNAVAEAVYREDGWFDPGAFQAKHGPVPKLWHGEAGRWDSAPRLLRLYLHPTAAYGSVGLMVPRQLREKLPAFVPKHEAPRLESVEKIAAAAVRQWTTSWWDEKKKERICESHDAPRIQRCTEQAAFQDLRTVLRLVEQQKNRGEREHPAAL